MPSAAAALWGCTLQAGSGACAAPRPQQQRHTRSPHRQLASYNSSRRGNHALAAAAAAAAAGGAAPPRLDPATLRLGRDIPIGLKAVTVAGCTFLLVVPDIDAVMEMYIAAGQADRDPYWCEPWPSALALCEELLSRPQLVRGRRVCELGAGLGLAGLAAAVAGAKQVVLLDREPLALQCALINAAINGLPAGLPAAEAAGAAGTAAAAAAAAGAAAGGAPGPSVDELLPFLSAEDLARLQEHRRLVAEQRQQRRQSSPAAPDGAAGGGAAAAGAAAVQGAAAGAAAAEPGAVQAVVFDWSQPVTVAPHDVMLVADCLYEAFSVQPVAEVAPKLLKRHGSRLVLADPPDRARHNRQAAAAECFLDILCEESGDFMVEESSEVGVPTWEESKQAWRRVPIALMHLRRAEPGDTVGVKLRRPQ